MNTVGVVVVLVLPRHFLTLAHGGTACSLIKVPEPLPEPLHASFSWHHVYGAHEELTMPYLAINSAAPAGMPPLHPSTLVKRTSALCTLDPSLTQLIMSVN